MDVDELSSLMVRYQAGDGGAVEELLQRLSPGLYRFFLAQSATRNLAEDLVQDTWLRIHRVRHTYRAGEPLLPWLYSIARRVGIDAYRKEKNRHPSDANVETLAAPQDSRSHNTIRLDLEPCLEILPASQREVVLLLKVTGMSVDEVARSLGTTAGAIKQKAHRAYRSLRRCLEASK